MSSETKLMFCLLCVIFSFGQIPSLVNGQGGDACASAPNRVERKICQQALRAQELTRRKEEMPKSYYEICKQCFCQDTGVDNEFNRACAPKCAKVPDSWAYHDPETFEDLEYVKCTAKAKQKPTQLVDIFVCMDLQCVHQVQKRTNRTAQPWAKALRKEYRMLTDAERQRFHAAMQEMAASNTNYGGFAAMHAELGEERKGAHHGSAFLPWHREFTKMFEFALRKIDPEVSLPYWDTALDARLKNPKDSVLFSTELMGATAPSGGDITHGFMANWLVQNRSDARAEKRISRQIGNNNGKPPTDEQIFSFLQQPQLEKALAFHDRYDPYRCKDRSYETTLENIHGYAHDFIGGDMGDPVTSANDPLFYLTHAFVDMLWELWREYHQTLQSRETAYPSNAEIERCSTGHHYARSVMNPFPIANIDGLSNKYTDNLYSYQLRPDCTPEMRDCGSKYLFCDGSHGEPRCVSKIREGSDCTGYFYDEDVCYQSACVQGICRKAP